MHWLQIVDFIVHCRSLSRVLKAEFYLFRVLEPYMYANSQLHVFRF